MTKSKVIVVQNINIIVSEDNFDDYICIIDIAKAKVAEITGGLGVVFATGTPVSNSMVELYTMMRYLQYDMLEEGYRDSTGKIRSRKHFGVRPAHYEPAASC